MDLDEITHILVSVVVLSAVFAYANGARPFTPPGFSTLFVEILLTVGAGFVLHELAHKFLAQSYGAHARYQAWPLGLGLSMVLALIRSPVIFAAPGAVYIYGRNITVEANGKISLVGPLTNAALAVIFLALAAFAPSGALRSVGALGASVNAFLGLFNMIPFYPLDGSKVWAWNKGAWIATVVGLILLGGL
ncbi:site-2 protease family protein [Candidatus Micrarchaeota archaeon]|nr:site-2 protease family protein [Candidatus Micrarchaeota archaeon]